MSASRLRGRGLPPYAAWGDSLTAGAGCSNVETKAYHRQIGLGLTPSRPTYNGGVGGNTSTQIKIRFQADTTYRSWTQLFWVGRNNFGDAATVKADIAEMVSGLSHRRFVVVGIVNSDLPDEYAGQPGYNQIIALNTDLAAIYGDRFVDARTPLVAAGAPGGSNPSPTDYARDVPPGALRFDDIHFLDAGYAIVAQTVAARLLALGL